MEQPKQSKKRPIQRKSQEIELKPVFVTPQKSTCKECTCYQEEPYVKNKKLNPCQKSPLTLYELTAKIVDDLPLPKAFGWSEEDVGVWLDMDVGLPEYKETFRENHINGMRLLMLEDPSYLAAINIKDLNHIQMIVTKIHQLFGTEIVKFSRSIGLPPRKPLTHCTFFKSRTGPSWGIRKNWTRCDILRWMKIIMPEPLYLDHWDLVWYQKPDFPKVKFARLEKKFIKYEYIPHYIPRPDICREILVPRKFRVQQNIPDAAQFIWMEKMEEPEVKEVKKKVVAKKSRLVPEKISLTGLRGKEFILARRKMSRPKFLP